jgi:ATP-dependent DNA helicase RecQ
VCGLRCRQSARDALQVSAWLQSKGINVQAYTGQTDEQQRPALEQALLNNEIKALVATMALGMGFDQPDLAFVIHFQTPGSVVAHYQQVGRAGRALSSAYGILLSGEEETRITDWFIASAFPTVDEVTDILGALRNASDGLSINELMGQLNVSKKRIEIATKLLELESPAPIVKQVVKQKRKWQLTAALLTDAFWKRTRRLTALRKEEQQQMQAYVRLPFGEHMHFLLNALDADPAKATPPLLPPLPGPVLLVDDIVHSRWTMTVGAWLLRENGSGEVWPLALSLAQTEADE